MIEYILGVLLLILAVALIVVIGIQQSKRKSGLSGSIAGNGASESYLARNKIASKDSLMKKITLVLVVLFVILVLALFIVGAIDPKETADASSAVSSAVSSVK